MKRLLLYFKNFVLLFYSTEIKLHKDFFIWNYRTTCFNEYIKNSKKYMTNSSIIQIKNQNQRSNILNQRSNVLNYNMSRTDNKISNSYNNNSSKRRMKKNS